MDLPSTHSDPRNTTLLSPDDHQRQLYQITTPRLALKSSTTTITKVTASNPAEEVAQIEWHSLGHNVMRFRLRGVDGNVKDYINASSIFGSSQYFTSAGGQQYKWDGNSLKSASGFEVAHWHRKTYGVFQTAHPAYLQVSQDALRDMDLDEVVVTWAYNQARIKKQNEAAAAAAVPTT